tara:strand:- start:1440 stop:1922 length:483 start_codon:yes stop_codon:yes gene_type:complete
MIETVEIRRNICLDHKNMNKNYKDFLLSKIKKITKNECTKKYGHIIDVKEIKEILDNKISAAKSSLIFDLIFIADILKPEIGKEIMATVCMITENGIFLEVHEKLNILIPLNELTEYKLQDDKYINKKNKKSIKYNDTIKVGIKAVKYYNQNFSCIGYII